MENSQKRYLILVGDPNQINTRGGSTYFFLKAGKALGFMGEGMPLKPEKLRLHRLFWNFFLWLRTGEKGGFQYSSMFLRKLFAQVELDDNPTEFISRFPLLPPAPWKENWRVNYHIDATLQQNFEDYGLATIVSQKVRKAALQQEQENYDRADRVICMSHWAAASVVNDYQISPAKVHVIGGGANLDEDTMAMIEPTSSSSLITHLNPLRLGFVGKDWRRKGLPFLLNIAEVLHRRDISVEVMVVGPAIEDLPLHPLMKPRGFISKSQDMSTFVEIIRSFHFGCLFSSAEAFGLSNLECLRLGVPVLATRIGGIPDTVPQGLGFLTEPNSSAETVADLLETFVRNPSTYNNLRQKVAARAKEFTWRQTVHNLRQVWQGSKDFCYDAISIC